VTVAKPSSGSDPFPWWEGLAVGILLAFLRSGGVRIAAGLAVASALIGSAGVTLIARDRYRRLVGTTAAILALGAATAIAPATRHWVATIVVTLVAVTIIIGRTTWGSTEAQRKRAVKRALALINDVAADGFGGVLPEGTRAVDLHRTPRGLRWTWKVLPQDAHQLKTDVLTTTMAAFFNRSRAKVDVAIHPDNPARFDVLVRDADPFTDAPGRPGDTDPARLPIGWDPDGKVLHLRLDTTRSPHQLVGGMTGSGKTNYLAVVADHHLAIGDDVWLLDPKGDGLDEYHDQSVWGRYFAGDDACRAAIIEAHQIMKDRRRWKGPRLILIIDEGESVLGVDKTADRAFQVILTEGRSKGVTMLLGIQSPRALTISGKAKAQFGTIVSFDVGNNVEDQILLGKGAPTCVGLPQGRAWMRSHLLGDHRRGFQALQAFRHNGLASQDYEQGKHGQPGQPLPLVASRLPAVAPSLPVGKWAATVLADLAALGGRATAAEIEDLRARCGAPVNRGTIGKTFAALEASGHVVRDGRGWRTAA
jgi:hypothetical protein